MLEERQNIIYGLLKTSGYLTVDEISKKVNYSLPTIRRDLASMELKGLIKRVHGGASIADSKSNESSFVIREQTFIEEKRLMSLEAIKFIKDGMSIMFDASSTVAQIIILLNQFKNLTCVTNGLGNGQLLSYKTNAKTYIIPGEVTKMTNSTGGIDAIKYVEKFNCDIYFFSCRGFSLEKGITEASIEQSLIKKKMADNSKTKVLLIDHSKIDEIFLANSISVKDIDIIITTANLSNNYLTFFAEHNIQVIIPKK
ncbi:MAG: DeoR/GlpR family DNA-binding transcription regulator [Bacillales bacterium]|nr:DeoR/GlpR family DNA-binding transcription regulator [Bacillales bacterium]